MYNEIILLSNNILKNVEYIKSKNPNSKLCAMVKANAYGVGLKEVVQILTNYVDYFGVACFTEAQIVKNFTHKPILIVGPIDEIDDLDFVYTCSSLEDVIRLKSTGLAYKIHIKINTGMNRYGTSDKREFKQMLNLIKSSNLKLLGIFTHFATTDDFVDAQMKKFLSFANFAKSIFPDIIVHADNSRVNQTKNHNLDMVRIGFDLYRNSSHNLLPAVEIRSRIVQVNHVKNGDMVGYAGRFVAKRNMRVAILPIGYADGLDMHYIGFNLKIKNKLCKILNICMDCCMVDVTRIDIKKGDFVYLVDKQNPLSNYAKYSHTIEYEVMTKFSSLRARRILSSVATQYEQEQ